jgi:CRP-like cAMP-binding protein
MEGLDELKHVLRAMTGQADKDLSVLDQLCSLRNYKKGDLFLRPGAVPLYAGYIVKGAFREFYTDHKGREYNKAFGFKGDFTGSYYDLNLAKPSTVTIEALADSTVIRLSHQKFQKLVKSDPFWVSVAYAFAHNLLMKKFEKEAQLLTLTAAERYELLRLQHPELEQMVQAYHVASYLGVTPISFSRIRAQNKKFLIK